MARSAEGEGDRVGTLVLRARNEVWHGALAAPSPSPLTRLDLSRVAGEVLY
jgi:hypothetical protein